METCLSKLEHWCAENDLAVNVDKTKMMYFYKNNDSKSKQLCTVNPPKLFIYNNEIEIVSTFKYLGIIIDGTLLFKGHYKHVENKMNNALKRMYSLRRLMSENVVKIFLSSFVISIVDYGINIWCVQSPADVCKLQNKLDRFIVTYYLNLKLQSKLKLRDMTLNNLMDRLDLLTIAERNKLMLCKFVYKFINNEMFEGWFTVSSSSSTDRPKLKVKRAESVLYKNSVKWRCTSEWNSLFADRKIKIDKTNENYNFVEMVKHYLLRMRSDIYFYL